MQSRAKFDLPASGVGGQRPAQKPPAQWETQSITAELGKEAPQGAEVTSKPTMRSYSGQMIAGRPGVIAQRSLAPLPGEVVTVLKMAPGGAVAEHLAGTGGFVETAPGNDDNIAGNGDFTGGADFAAGSASRTTGKSIKGQTAGKGMI